MRAKALTPSHNQEFDNRLFGKPGRRKHISAGYNIVVMGASAGGVETLTRLVATFQGHLPAAFFVVTHLSAHAESALPCLLERAGRLPAHHAKDNELIRSGHIYVAPPDYHMLINRNRIHLSHGPKENRHRPAIDPLFRTAAQHHGSRVIGIVLSGGLDDGSLGLKEIKEKGGIAIVQDPSEALYPDMPRNAMMSAQPHYCLRISEMGLILSSLIGNQFKEHFMKDNPRTKEGELNVAGVP
jgi:two-component system, chemotaxis family, protein-glutamate methylesterase/glutaminase